MTDPTIRLARPDEAEALSHMWLAFQREHNARYVRYVRQTKENRAQVAVHFGKLAGQAQLWVATVDDAPVGYAAVVPNLPQVDLFWVSAALTDLWIEPAFRNRGLGRALIDRVRADVAARGLHALTINVMAGNPARAMYRRAGFQPFTEKLVMPLAPGMVKTGPDYPED